MSAKAQKVLVTGPASSSISSYFTKLAALQQKHSFDIVLALDLFSDASDDSLELAKLLAGEIEVPVQVYVCVGGGTLPSKVIDKAASGEELCKNVTLLNKTTVLTLASGVKLAAFGGSFDQATFEAPSNELTRHFTSGDVESFITSLSPAPSKSSLPSPPLPAPDILLTHAIPASLPTGSSKAAQLGGSQLCAPLDEIIRGAKPKYHFFGGGGTFWEREPFTWGKDQGGGVCRAIGLGEMGNKSKERWFYAFSITPNAPATAPPANATASPFGASGSRGYKRTADELAGGDMNDYGVPNYIFADQGRQDQDRGRKKGKHGALPDHYSCNICQQKGHWIQDCPMKADRPHRGGGGGHNHRPIQPDECWFCLSNPKVTKHLIASIGSETYLTLPKGQLPPTEEGAKAGLAPVPGGGHVLIIPACSYVSVSKDQAVPIVSEIERYKSALRECYAKYGAKMLSFEVGRLSGKGGHAHVQVCPIPEALAEKAETVFRTEGTKVNIEFEEDADAVLKRNNVVDNYFRIDLPDGKTLVHVIQPGVPFGLQFGRQATAVLLGTPERADWKACVTSEKEEKEDCKRFKAAFKAFDPAA